jgi:hypothetical protein
LTSARNFSQPQPFFRTQNSTYTREPAKEPLVNSQEYFYEQAYQALAQAEAETAETAKN